MSTQIRYAVTEDLPKLKTVIGASFPRVYRYFALHSVSDPSEPTLIYVVDHAVAGLAKLITFQVNHSKYGCILWIAVHPRFRRRGVASALTKSSIEYFRDHAARAVFASTQRHNVGALATLGRSGFVHVGFLGLRRLFGWRIFMFYRAIWFAPGEVVLMSGPYF